MQMMRNTPYRHSMRALLGLILLLLSVAVQSQESAPSVEKPPETRLAKLIRQAQAGSAAAQFDLGMIYENGEGIPKNEAQAAEWFKKAAAQGNAKAQTILGRKYRDGEGVTQDDMKAVYWLQKSAAKGVVEAQAYLGMMYRRGDGVTQDDVKGVYWCRKAADQGNGFAQNCLGSAYKYGKGVPKDTAKAMDLYLKASAQGDANASSALYLMYIDGDGVPKSSERAMEWLKKAADQGDSWAQYILARNYEHGDGVPQDIELAVEWYKKSAAQGDDSAQVRLARMYVGGVGVPRDLVLAYAWCNIAAASDFETEERKAAILGRRDLGKVLSPAQIAEAERLSSVWKKGVLLAREQAARAGRVANQKPRMESTGTVFFVSNAGQAITNYHVIKNCKNLRVAGHEGTAKVIAEDSAADLALLQVSGQIDSVASIVSEPQKLRQGDDIVVFGFPLASILSAGGNLTPGVVSALTGLGNNTNQIQITASIQPGSSGSPVMNKRGEVTGVISMKLSDERMAEATGSVGQNVNFAVNGQTLKMFLDAHRVTYKSPLELVASEKSLADIGDDARKWTFVVECWK